MERGWPIRYDTILVWPGPSRYDTTRYVFCYRRGDMIRYDTFFFQKRGLPIRRYHTIFLRPHDFCTGLLFEDSWACVRRRQSAWLQDPDSLPREELPIPDDFSYRLADTIRYDLFWGRSDPIRFFLFAGPDNTIRYVFFSGDGLAIQYDAISCLANTRRYDMIR